jgi:hypothetical protein
MASLMKEPRSWTRNVATVSSFSHASPVRYLRQITYRWRVTTHYPVAWPEAGGQLMRRCVILSISIAFIAAACPSVAVRQVSTMPLRLDSIGVALRFEVPFRVPTSFTTLCLTLDSTRYVIGAMREVTARPRRPQDSSSFMVELGPPDSTAISIGGEMETATGERSAMRAAGYASRNKLCLSTRTLHRETAYTTLRLRSSKPIRIEELAWHISTG